MTKRVEERGKVYWTRIRSPPSPPFIMRKKIAINLLWVMTICLCLHMAYLTTPEADILIPSNAHHHPYSPTEEERSHGYTEFNNEQ